MGDSRNKNAEQKCGTKIGGDPAEQKTAEQKTVEQKLVGTLRHWVMGKCKKVRRTKTVEQNWWGPSGTLNASTERSAGTKMWNKKCRTKIWWDPEGP